MEPSIAQVQHLVDKLSPIDQAHLLEYLSTRIAKADFSISSSTNVKSTGRGAAWDEFFRVGDELLKGDKPKSETLTSTLLSMRR